MKMRNWYRQYHLKSGQVITEYIQGVQDDGEVGWEAMGEDDEEHMKHLFEGHDPVITVYDHLTETHWSFVPDNLAAVTHYMRVEDDPEMDEAIRRHEERKKQETAGA